MTCEFQFHHYTFKHTKTLRGKQRSMGNGVIAVRRVLFQTLQTEKKTLPFRDQSQGDKEED